MQNLSYYSFKTVIASLFVFISCLSFNTHATIFNPLLNVDIDGTLYDVTFHSAANDSFNALWDADDDGIFGGGSSVFNVAPTFWQNQSLALVARDTIISRFGVEHGHAELFDGFLVPYATNSTNGSINSGNDTVLHYFDNDFLYTNDTLSQTGIVDSDTRFVIRYPIASFSPSQVPEPFSLLLLSLGFVSLKFRQYC